MERDKKHFEQEVWLCMNFMAYCVYEAPSLLSCTL